jgi:hypothetical protein
VRRRSRNQPGTADVEQIDQMRAASELLAQRAMERVLDLVVQSLDVNELARQVDMDALLRQLDLNSVIAKIDVNAVLSQVDVQALVERIDIDKVVRDTDIGATIAMSSGHVASEAVDILRSQAITLDDRVDHWVRLLRRGDSGLATPPPVLDTGART